MGENTDLAGQPVHIGLRGRRHRCQRWRLNLQEGFPSPYGPEEQDEEQESGEDPRDLIIPQTPPHPLEREIDASSDEKKDVKSKAGQETLEYPDNLMLGDYDVGGASAMEVYQKKWGDSEDFDMPKLTFDEAHHGIPKEALRFLSLNISFKFAYFY